MEETVETILDTMSTVKKPQKQFMLLLLSALMVFVGKATFRNLSRYSELHEKRISRWFRRSFDFLTFNGQLLSFTLPQGSEIIAAIDASFLSKSGKHTEGLGMFWNGKISKAEKGLELSLITLVDIKANTAYALDAKQTIDTQNQSRTDKYIEHIEASFEELKRQGICYVSADGYYTKKKFVDRVCSEELHLVGKLRVDARMQWFYQGEYSGKGRPKRFDGKVNIKQDLKRFNHIATLEDGVDVYAATVYSSHLKRKIRVVLLRSANQAGKVGSALLYSTDVELTPLKLITYYKARFQIEFVLRDAKQHTGLMDCQARCKEAIHTHINASLSALNWLKLEDRRNKKTNDETVISIASWKRLKFNQQYMKTLFYNLDLDLNETKVAKVFSRFSHYGGIAS